MSIDETPAERAYARQERVPTTVYDKVDRRWVDSMSVTGRRAATSVAASKGRQWVNRTLDFKPSRGEVRAWFELVLDERRELHNRLEKATRDAQEVAGLRRELAAVLAQRDDALEDLAAERAAHDADVADLAAQRDDALADASELRDRVWFLDEDRTEMSKRCEELRAALEETIAERNELTREAALRDQFLLGSRIGRASCPHPVVGGAE